MSVSDFSALLALLRGEREALIERSVGIREELGESLSQLFNSGVSEEELRRVLERLSLIFDRVQSLRGDLERYEERVSRFEDLSSYCAELSGESKWLIVDAAQSSLVSIESLRSSVEMIRTNSTFLSDSNTRFLDDALTGLLGGWESVRIQLEGAKAGIRTFTMPPLDLANGEQAKIVTQQLQNLKAPVDTVINQAKLFLTMLDKLHVLAERISQEVPAEFEERFEASREEMTKMVSPVEQFSDELQMRIVDLKIKWHLFETHLTDEF